MKQPTGLLCLPLVVVEPMSEATFNFPELESVKIPRIAECVPSNVFTSESTCLLSRVVDMGVGFPTRCIFVRKQKITSEGNRWVCHYSGVFRPFILPSDHPPRVKRANDKNVSNLGKLTIVGKPRKPESDSSQSDTSSCTSRGSNISSCVLSDVGRADDISFWFSEDETPEVSNRKERIATTSAIPITSRPRVLASQHDAGMGKPEPA